MNFGFIRIEKEGVSLLGGILFVVLLTSVIRPRQLDNAHMIGILTPKGGRAIHAGTLYLGQDLGGAYSLTLTASVLPPVSGDILIEFTGSEPLRYTVSSRNPPVLPVTNRLHPWYQFEEQTLRGVQPFDDLVIHIRTEAPSQPAEYEIILRDPNTPQQIYLKIPVSFTILEKSAIQSTLLENWPCH